MILFLALLSTTFDWVEFSVFLLFSDLISKTFFSPNIHGDILIGAISWATAYLSRGIGSYFLFPYIKKFKSSKTAIIFTCTLVVLPNIFITCMPSYRSIGAIACFIFLFFRLIQGLGIGIDFPLSIFNIFKNGHSQLKTSMALSCGVLGVLISFSIFVLIKKHQILSQLYIGDNWRYLFATFSLLGLISLGIRIIVKKTTYQNFLESEDFGMKFSFKEFVPNFFISYSYAVIFYTFFTYIPMFNKGYFNELFTPLILLMAVIFSNLLAFRGNIQRGLKLQKIGYIFCILICIIFAIFSISLIYQSLLLSIIIAFYASSFVFIMLASTSFYTFSLSYNFGQGFGAFLTPIICNYLAKNHLSIYYYISLFTIIGFYSLINIIHFKKDKLPYQHLQTT